MTATARLVDWDLAATTARRLVPPGPRVDFHQAADLVSELLGLAADAEGHVRGLTGLVPVDGVVDPTVVVDRIGWAEANTAGFRTVLEPVVDLLAAKKGRPSPLAEAVGSRVTGVQIGALLSFLATKVLGQYEIFLPAGQGTGRLVLVGPNLLETEEALGLDPHDFRLWVCLHEVTHRTQFTAVPWLREHVQGEIRAFVEASDLDPAAMRARLGAVAATVTDAVRGRGEGGLLEAVQTPEQRAVLDRITGFMSLVEGHADYVMDAVGPEVIPTLTSIRERFEQRRGGAGTLDRFLRRLIGLEAKTRQYREGRHFVRAVVEEVGMTSFNRVWTSPETLPSLAEVRAPSLWVDRVVRAGGALPGPAPALPA